jgi:hypothetical protein
MYKKSLIVLFSLMLFASFLSCGDETTKSSSGTVAANHCWMIFFTDTTLSAVDMKYSSSTSWSSELSSTMSSSQYLLLWTTDTSLSSVTIDARVKVSGSSTYSTVSGKTIAKGQIAVYRYSGGTLSCTITAATDYQAYIDNSGLTSSIDNSIEGDSGSSADGLFNKILGSVPENAAQ